MDNHEMKQRLIELFTAASEGHHRAFAATDGVDPDWPIWYAEHLHDPLGKALQTEFSKSRLIYCLMNADFERTAREPEASWPAYYADHFIERFAPPSARDSLALYHFRGCPFCALVRAAIDRLGVDIELRDIHADTRHRDDLVAARGRSTVPVLRISSPNAEERWIPESADIIHHLERSYG